VDRDTRSIDQIMSSIDSHSRIDITRNFPSARVEIGASQIAEVSRIANSPSLFQNNHYSTSSNSSFQSSHFGQIQTAQSIMPSLEINSSQTFDSTDPGERIKQATLKAQESNNSSATEVHDHPKVSQKMRETRAFFNSEIDRMKKEMESLRESRITQAREEAEQMKNSPESELACNLRMVNDVKHNFAAGMIDGTIQGAVVGAAAGKTPFSTAIGAATGGALSGTKRVTSNLPKINSDRKKCIEKVRGTDPVKVEMNDNVCRIS
jgi:adenylosuccinate synthase